MWIDLTLYKQYSFVLILVPVVFDYYCDIIIIMDK